MTAVALVGANGHGLRHREHIESLQGVDLVALCDVAPVDDPPPGVPVFTDHTEMLAAVRPQIVVVSTPPRTHLPIALAALRRGADVLLEKPPVLDLTEHSTLESAIAETGHAVQVGFQALASPELPRLRALAPCDISVVGAWQRDDGYWGRSPWAGRLPLDGALRNPFAHALMQALAIGQSEPVRVEVAWCRVRDIEVDDTSTLRVTLADGRRILIAITLAGEEFIDGELRAGPVSLNFRERQGESLLANLVAHRRSGRPLLAPLSDTRRFTAVVQALSRMPLPGRVGDEHLVIDGPDRILPGVNDVLRRCGRDFRLLNEIDNPWAATATGGAATIA